jgi:dihydroorotase-like cyclic amidohydrolase
MRVTNFVPSHGLMARIQQTLSVVALAVLLHWVVDPAGRSAHTACSLHGLNSSSYVLFSKRVVTPGGTLSAVVHVSNGLVAAVTPAESAPQGALDYTDAVVSPVRHSLSRHSRAEVLTRSGGWQGLVDVHVHLNEPGRCAGSCHASRWPP